VHPNVHLHFTPTYASWLNQVELWCTKIDRDVIARGVFTSVSDLKKKLRRYIRHYNKSPRTVKWKYADPSRHLSTQFTGRGWKGGDRRGLAEQKDGIDRGKQQKTLLTGTDLLMEELEAAAS
jgi:hypothetical protein